MTRRLIVRDHVANADVFSFAERAGWTFAGDIDRDPERGVFYEVKWETADGSAVHYVVDEFADVPYLVVAHDDPEAAETTMGGIGKALAVWTPEDLLDDCYVNVWPAGWAKALLRLGAGAPLKADQDVVDHVVFSSEHLYPEVRRAAVWAMVYTGWPEFREALDALARNDDDPQVAREAQQALEQLAGVDAGPEPQK